MGAAGHLGLLAKQQLPVDEGVLLQPGPGHGGAGSAVPRLAVAEIEPALVVQGEIEQAPLTLIGDGGQTRDEMALAPGVDAQQAARALANQIAAFRQQDQPPGMVEPLHQGGQCQRPERAHQADQQQCKQSQQGGSPLGRGLAGGATSLKYRGLPTEGGRWPALRAFPAATLKAFSPTQGGARTLDGAMRHGSHAWASGHGHRLATVTRAPVQHRGHRAMSSWRIRCHHPRRRQGAPCPTCWPASQRRPSCCPRPWPMPAWPVCRWPSVSTPPSFPCCSTPCWAPPGCSASAPPAPWRS
ncbi:hypothetical protein D3C79_748900 [compost metagenome]